MKINIFYKLKSRCIKTLSKLKSIHIKSIHIFIILICLFTFWVTFDFSTNISAEFLWFKELNYLPVLITKLQTETLLWIITFVITTGFLFTNLRLASIFKYPKKNSYLSARDKVIVKSVTLLYFWTSAPSCATCGMYTI